LGGERFKVGDGGRYRRMDKVVEEVRDGEEEISSKFSWFLAIHMLHATRRGRGLWFTLVGEDN
jgi:hypothetical protein